MNKSFRLSEDIERAISDSRPVVALESTVIAHGLPRPQNLQTALRLEQVIRETGVIPATIGVVTGQIRVGLSEAEVNTLANSDAIGKLSTRDLPIAVARGWNGATTVAATVWIAHRVGIKVFATGGIGGVHRGSSPDISADLPELARTPMIVICSGAKIVLDLPGTREWLETHSITVVGYGCDEMPAFYSRSSGLPVDVRCDSFDEVIDIYQAQRELGVDSALLVVVPVSSEAEVETPLLTKVLDESLRKAAQKKISGRELTPFLLARMAEGSEGATLRANIALLENNARVAAGIARALPERTSGIAA